MQTSDVILADDNNVEHRINEIVLKLALSFLSIRDLLAVSATNHHFLDHVRSREDLWNFFYHGFDSLVESHPFMDESNAECRCEMKRLLMRIPPRMHGQKVDQDLCHTIMR